MNQAAITLDLGDRKSRAALRAMLDAMEGDGDDRGSVIKNCTFLATGIRFDSQDGHAIIEPLAEAEVAATAGFSDLHNPTTARSPSRPSPWFSGDLPPADHSPADAALRMAREGRWTVQSISFATGLGFAELDGLFRPFPELEAYAVVAALFVEPAAAVQPLAPAEMAEVHEAVLGEPEAVEDASTASTFESDGHLEVAVCPRCHQEFYADSLPADQCPDCDLDHEPSAPMLVSEPSIEDGKVHTPAEVGGLEIPSETEASTPQGADAPGITGMTGPAPAGAEGVGEDGAEPFLSSADAAPEEAEGASAPEAAAGGSPAPAVVKSEGVSESVAEPVAQLPEPDWPALIARVDAGESLTEVAASAGVPWKRLQGRRLGARKREESARKAGMPVPAAPKPAATKPAPVREQSVAAAPARITAPAKPQPPSAPKPPAKPAAPGAAPAFDPDAPDLDGWSLREDQRLIFYTVMGKSDGHAAGQLHRKPPEIRARRERLLAEYGMEAPAILKDLNAKIGVHDAAARRAS